MRIAIFHYEIIPTNPTGSCIQKMLRGFCHEHEFTIFAVEFKNPCPDCIQWVHIPAPTRPLALLFVIYHLLAPLYYCFFIFRNRIRFDQVFLTESTLSFGNISYVHFCHRCYLKHFWKYAGIRGIRKGFRWLNHWLHAIVEPLIFRRVKWIVVPSFGLKRELEEEYPFIQGKITVIPNPLDIEWIQHRQNFDREKFRHSLGLTLEDIMLVFIALGNFEHKGLPLILEVLNRLDECRFNLLVVGGKQDLLNYYRRKVRKMGLDEKVNFIGMQGDVRPYLWAGDLFVFPSLLETFSLVCFEAAGASLPLLVTHLYGIEEFMCDGETGFVVDRTPEGVLEGLVRFLILNPEDREAMGKKAQRAVGKYRIERFIENWTRFFIQTQKKPYA